MNTREITAALLARKCEARYPNSERIIALLHKIRMALFPGYFQAIPETETPEEWLNKLLAEIEHDLSEEINGEIAKGLIDAFAEIQLLLCKDAQAGFAGDPAAGSAEEVILTYPGFFAIFTYRLAHFLFVNGVPFIPRMMSEYAHSVTGIDIHPGATIGEYFFIDHGTGVVIGETSVIGHHVKLYQGVTIGALSIKEGQGRKDVKRHPTIGDGVTIYSGASILGGDTVIGEGSVVGGSAFVVRSVPAHTVVKTKNFELQTIVSERGMDYDK